jgi:small-conductance mechanosensitive channel
MKSMSKVPLGCVFLLLWCIIVSPVSARQIFSSVAPDSIAVATAEDQQLPVNQSPGSLPKTETANSDSVRVTFQSDSVTASRVLGTDADSASTTTVPTTPERPAPLNIPPPGQIFSFSKIFSAIVALLILILVTKIVSAILSNFSEKFAGQRLLIKRLIPITKVLLWSMGLYFIIAGILQPPLETIITVSASIGIAVGFASQDILRNIFGGVMIILDRPFQVGDKIEVDRRYGEVLQIGLRSVRIVTEDDSVVTIPNAEIMNKAVSNANSSAFDCQVVAELFLSPSADIGKVVQVCRLSALTSRYVYLNKPIYVHTTHITSGPQEYLKVRIKAYVLDIRFEQELRSDITAIALRTLRSRGVVAPT